MEELDQMIDEMRRMAEEYRQKANEEYNVFCLCPAVSDAAKSSTYVEQCEEKAEELEKIAEYLEELKILRNFDKAINLLQEYMDNIN